MHNRMYEQSIAEFQKVAALTGGGVDRAPSLACAYALAGKQSVARGLLEDMERNYPRTHVSPYFIAAASATLGDRDRAFKWLDKAYLERDTGLDTIKYDPAF